MVEEGPGQDDRLPADTRLDHLERRVAEAQRKEAVRTGTAPASDANEQMGQKVLSLLIGGLLGGTLIGWLLDKLLGTWPTLFITLMVLGTASGFWSIIKLSNTKTKRDL
ncbi:ATP synthase protein I [Sphingomonas kaistensis]|uniref:ATP synthase protein I n=2 Tax=Sphingomonas kaistensis TaxID=298708 RepID=A0A7X5Y7E5_9SPHN|nr:ATP synthase protein I [Sphingomonas kaistensis]